MLTVIITLVALGTVRTQRTCFPISTESQVCQLPNGYWSSTWIQTPVVSREPIFRSDSYQVSFRPDQGIPTPIPRIECTFPCFHALTQTPGVKYETGEVGTVETGRSSWKYNGLISSYLGGITYQGVTTCSTASCEPPTSFPLGGGYIYDLETQTTPHPKQAAWLATMSTAFQNGPVLCYAATQSDFNKFDQERCNHFLWNGYDGPGLCHTTTSAFTASSFQTWWANHSIAVPFYGYSNNLAYTARGDPCTTGQTDGLDTFSTLNLSPGGQSFCSSVTSGTGTCVFPTPIQMKNRFAVQLSNPKVTGMSGWAATPRNEKDPVSVNTKLRGFAVYWSRFGPSMLGHNDPYTTANVTSLGFEGVCQWVERLIIPAGVSCSSEIGPIPSFFSGRILCNLRCNRPAYYVTATNLVSNHAVFTPPRQKRIMCESHGNGLFLATTTSWGLLNGESPCVSAGHDVVFCETSIPCSLVTSICGARSCSSIQTYHGTFEAPLQLGFLSKGRYYPNGTVRKSRDLSNTGVITVETSGSYTTVCYYSQQPQVCVVSDGSFEHPFPCPDASCCETLSPFMFRPDTPVRVSCGQDLVDFKWSIPASQLESMTLSAVWGLFVSQPWYIQGFIVISIIWAIRFCIYLLQLKMVVLIVKMVTMFFYEFFWDLPGTLRRTGASITWGLTTRNYCECCGCDTDLTCHMPDGTCSVRDPEVKPKGCCLCPSGVPTPHHFLTCHMNDYISIIWGLFPWNWFAYWKAIYTMSSSSECAPKPSSPRVYKTGPRASKSYLYMTIVCLALPGAFSVSDVVSTSVCSGDRCTLSTTIIQEGLWPGDTSCYNLKSPDVTYPLCVNLGSISFSQVLPITRCRLDLSIKQYTLISCASQDYGCSGYQGQLDQYGACYTIWDQTIVRSGYTNWGCTLPNVNSACIKAKAFDSGAPTHCEVSVSDRGLSYTAPVCAISNRTKSCSTDGQILTPAGTITYAVETNARTPFPTRLQVAPDGSLRSSVDPENGCFRYSKEKYSSIGCGTGVIPFSPGTCRWVIDHWWSSYVQCDPIDPLLCDSEFAFPAYHADCNLTNAVLNPDNNSYTVSGVGCLQSTFKITMRVSLNVTKAAPTGVVTSLIVSQCGGTSGTVGEATCTVAPICTGDILSCHMGSPSSMDLVCNYPNRVVFTSSNGTTVRFDCGGVSINKTMNLEIHSADHFVDPRPQPPDNNPIVDLPYWVWILVALGILLLLMFFWLLVSMVRARNRYMKSE